MKKKGHNKDNCSTEKRTKQESAGMSFILNSKTI